MVPAVTTAGNNLQALIAFLDKKIALDAALRRFDVMGMIPPEFFKIRW
jgi:hypothetical protein